MAVSRKRPAKAGKIGYLIVLTAIFCVSGILIYMAERQFSGTAWGELLSHEGEFLEEDGFIVVEIGSLPNTTDGVIDRMLQTSGIAFAAQADDSPAFSGEEGNLPAVRSFATFDDLKEMELPSVASVPLDVEDFGPLPKDLLDFESIILSSMQDGTQLPEDVLSELATLDLPEEEVVLAESAAKWQEHIVKSGETLSDIAMKYGEITVQDIIKANEISNAHKLADKQLLLIPNDEATVEDTLEEVRIRKSRVAALKEKIIPLKVQSYKVQDGDNLWAIANAQNLELDTLAGSNTLQGSILRPGDVLRIPNQDGIFYKFKKNETLDAVLKRYGVGRDRVKKVNVAFNFNSIKAGDEIFLPGARPEAIMEPAAPKKAANTKPDTKAASQQPKKTVAETKASRSFRWPVVGKITSPFGWRRHPITRRNDFHTGVDIKAPKGRAIVAAKGGTVAYSGWMGGYGKVVVINHDKSQSTLYAHCSTLNVKKGQQIKSGQTIAQVGSTGRTTGAHLHFEVRNGNSPTNPLKYLK